MKLITWTYGHDKPGDGKKKPYTGITPRDDYRTGQFTTVPATSSKGKKFITGGIIKSINDINSDTGKAKWHSLYDRDIKLRVMPGGSIKTLPGYVLGSKDWGSDSQTRRNQARAAFGGTMIAPRLDARATSRLISRTEE